MRNILIYFLVFSLAACQKTRRNLNEEIAQPSQLEGHYTYVSNDILPDRKVYYQIKDGFAVAEGDIILGTAQEAESARIQTEEGKEDMSSIAHRSKSAYWENGVIPYVIEEGFTTTARIQNAIDHIQSNTHLKFTKRTNEEDYISFHLVDQGCSAHVGRHGGVQLINLESACSAGNTAHEILHAAGFWHEQSRKDRDSYIKINWDNISKEERHNFDQELADGIDIGEYDFASIMHYGAYAFSKNGKPTMTKLDGSVEGFGSRTGLSPKDVKAINQLYPAS